MIFLPIRFIIFELLLNGQLIVKLLIYLRKKENVDCYVLIIVVFITKINKLNELFLNFEVEVIVIYWSFINA